ncbi:MAG: type II toxin-antitoxin system Phd/YefM family antitoxin [Desulfobacteraceae bacterium]|nr:MAG: type II toxin-antitoxin system Phd/YefM family antitoxin [Desulfobacteraceae bacterium]
MDTLQVNIHEAKTQLSKLIQAALNGREVIIARGNKPVVRLEVLPEARSDRKIGNAKGLILSMADDFDEPLDDFREYME